MHDELEYPFVSRDGLRRLTPATELVGNCPHPDLLLYVVRHP